MIVRGRGKKNMKIEPIILSPDKQEFLDNFLELQNSPIRYEYHYSPTGRIKKIKKIIGCTLCQCGNIPKFKITYQFKGITKLERYCDSCFNKIKEREKEVESLLMDREIIKPL